MSLPSKAFRILINDGPVTFCMTSYSFIERKLKEKYAKRKIDSPTTNLELNGYEQEIKTDSQPTSDSLIYLLKEEKPGLESLINELEEDDIFWDIGAHFGIYSVLASNIVNNDNIYIHLSQILTQER